MLKSKLGRPGGQNKHMFNKALLKLFLNRNSFAKVSRPLNACCAKSAPFPNNNIPARDWCTHGGCAPLRTKLVKSRLGRPGAQNQHFFNKTLLGNEQFRAQPASSSK